MTNPVVKARPQARLALLEGTLGERASFRLFEFFAARIRNPNTREAYLRAFTSFLSWTEKRGLTLESLTPVAVAAYIEQHPGAPATIKQHLAAIRMAFDYLVTGGITSQNPAAAVKGPRTSATRGKTPALTGEEARQLLDSIPTQTLSELRDRAMISIMLFSFARISAVLRLNVEDYYPLGKRYWIRLHEKGGRFHEVPAHHLIEEYLDDYLAAADITSDRKGPIFRAVARKGKGLGGRLNRRDALAAIKRRAKTARLFPEQVCCHSFRATGITIYLQNGGTLEKAQQIAAHASPRTTKLYDRSSDELTLDEIERIII